MKLFEQQPFKKSLKSKKEAYVYEEKQIIAVYSSPTEFQSW